MWKHIEHPWKCFHTFHTNHKISKFYIFEAFTMSSAQATRNSTAASLELPSVIFMKLMYLSREFALITGYWHLAWMMYGCNILSATIWEWPRLSVLLLGGHNLEISARERPVRQHNAWEGEVSGRNVLFWIWICFVPQIPEFVAISWKSRNTTARETVKNFMKWTCCPKMSSKSSLDSFLALGGWTSAKVREM